MVLFEAALQGLLNTTIHRRLLREDKIGIVMKKNATTVVTFAEVITTFLDYCCSSCCLYAVGGFFRCKFRQFVQERPGLNTRNDPSRILGVSGR